MAMSDHKIAVPRHWLLGLAGGMWLAVGLMLAMRGAGWLAPVPDALFLARAAACVLTGWMLGRTALARVAGKNIDRIAKAPDRACAFSFQAWRGYMMIALMILMGVLLRHSSLPRAWLAYPYAVMGVALVRASLLYFAALRRSLRI